MDLSFHSFYSSWFEQLHQLVLQLSSSAAAGHRTGAEGSKHHDQDHLGNLVDKFMSHYTEYYRVKGLAVERDVLSVVAAPWATTLERSLHWIAGWRPTTVFHLIYTESSILFESRIADILRGVKTGDLGDLSPTQFR